MIYAYIAAAVMLLGAAVGLEMHGHSRGVDDKQAEWTAAENKRAATETAARAADTDQAYTMAAEYESQANELEQRYAKTSADLRKALQRPFSCPPGQPGSVGDIVLPAAVVRGMFNRDLADPAAPGAAASQPDGAVR